MWRTERGTSCLSPSVRWLYRSPSLLPAPGASRSDDWARTMRCACVSLSSFSKNHLRRQCGVNTKGHALFSRCFAPHYGSVRSLSGPALVSNIENASSIDHSAAEAAFEAAMLGAFTRSSAEVQVCKDVHDSMFSAQETRECSAIAPPTLRSSQRASASLNTAKPSEATDVADRRGGNDASPPGKTTAVSGTVDDRRGVSPLSSSHPAPSPMLHEQDTSLSSEEAFERALYNDFVEAADAPDSTTEIEDTAATIETKTAKTPHEAFETEELVKDVEREDELPEGEVKLIQSSYNDIAAAEAAFERALYGLDEPKFDISLEDKSKSMLASLTVNGEVVDAASPNPATPRAQMASILNDTLASFPVDHAKRDRSTESAATDNGVNIHEDLSPKDVVDEEEDEHLFEAAAQETVSKFDSAETTAASSIVMRADAHAGEDVTSKKRKAAVCHMSVPGPLLPLPPPTVSMVCPLNFESSNDAVTDDRNTLQDALFGLNDHHTTVVTHLDPADRIASCMPLLDLTSKRNLFYESGWLFKLQEHENMWIQEMNTNGDGSTSATVGKERRVTPTISAESYMYEAALAGSLPPPPTHREVVGRSKVLRCLLYRLLRAPHLWWDQVQELVWMAVKEARTRDEERSNTHGAVNVDRTSPNDAHSPQRSDVAHEVRLNAAPLCQVMSEQLMRSAMTRIFGTPPSNVHFFSDALRREIMEMYGGMLNTPYKATVASPSLAAASFSAFTGPTAAWKAFVLTHRLDQTRVCAPHVMPFSCGELRPTITATELTPLRYCNAASSWPSTEDGGNTAKDASDADVGGSSSTLTPISRTQTHHDEEGDPATSQEQSRRAEMDEKELNAYLFGEESAQLSAAVRPSDGIFVIYGQDGVAFEEEDKFHAAEEALRKAAEQEAEEARLQQLDRYGTLTALVPQQSPLERAFAEEMTRVHLYDVDQVVLELTNTEDRDGGALSSSFHSSKAFPSRELFSLPPSGRGRGRGVQPRWRTKTSSPFQLYLQNKEDVQLAALWQSFVNASTGDLLDNLLHVQRHAAKLVCAAAVELALQKAFWLLFYARDEVRAVTHPQRTYETVWGLHEQLIELLTLTPSMPNDGSTSLKSLERKKITTARIPFDHLALESQVSYTCFGCSHLPLRRNAQTSISTSVLPHPFIHPYELYAALGDGRSVSAVAITQMKKTASETDSSSLNLTDVYRTLLPLQQSAVGFCFPQNASEEAEMALRTASDAMGHGAAMRESVEAAASVSTIALRSYSKRGMKIARRMGDALQRPSERHVSTEEVTEKVVERVEKQEEHQEDLLSIMDEDTFGVEEMAASTLAASAATKNSETAKSTEPSQRQFRDVLEASVYRCLCSLRATGMLPMQSRLPPTDNNLLFTAVQQAAIQQALDIIVASIHSTPAEEVGDAPAQHMIEGTKERPEPETHEEDGTVLTNAAATVDSTQEKPVKSCRRQGRKKQRDAKETSKAVTLEENTCSTFAYPTARNGKPKSKQQQKESSDVTVESPLKRKRGRPPRVMNPDGTYTKAAYVHTASYLEKKQRQKACSSLPQ